MVSQEATKNREADGLWLNAKRTNRRTFRFSLENMLQTQSIILHFGHGITLRFDTFIFFLMLEFTPTHDLNKKREQSTESDSHVLPLPVLAVAIVTAKETSMLTSYKKKTHLWLYLFFSCTPQ